MGQLPPYLFPPVSWFLTGARQGSFVVAGGGYFEKQTLMSRYAIAGPNTMQNLIVPVIHTGGPKQLGETRISRIEKWPREHANAIKSAYGKSPFFEFYDYKILPVLQKEHETLWDMIRESISVLHRALLPESELLFTEDIFSPLPEIKIPPFPQVFEDRFGFRENVSALDLLFNLGPEAEDYLLGR
jgi:hypothetical protein